jgi:DNA modification methylase
LNLQRDSIDWIITDPPYAQEYLAEYQALSEFAARVLKPGGRVICMSGQSYLPEVIRLLEQHLTYHWTLAYLTPGPAVDVWQRKVKTNWKPLLWFVKPDFVGHSWVGDVCHSDARDKAHFEWGQSLSGMKDIFERFTEIGQTICDPFMGSGTTSVAALSLGRLFVGADVSRREVDTSLLRILRLEKRTSDRRDMH